MVVATVMTMAAGAGVGAAAGVAAGMGTRAGTGTGTVRLPVGVRASIHTILTSCPSGSFKIKISKYKKHLIK